MEYLGYFLFFIMGSTLGLIGAGGSILSIPILVYCFHIPMITATSYALVIVGFTAWTAAGLRFKEVAWKKALLFGIPSCAGVFVA
ncbi:MAG: TSUP family transporter, partial [Alphaproteobacteria bacterium]|nr:TSUP family transporter [Alphaproteobacteria bacterium]